MLPAGLPRFHARWSMSPSTWQDAQAPVPFPESLASYKNPRPCSMVGGVGSVPTATSPDFVMREVSIIAIVLESRLSEYNVAALALRASPRGPRLFLGSALEPDPLGSETSTNDSTFPLVSTWATRSVPKAATYMKFPLGSKTTLVGCDSAVLSACGFGRML